ncbi:LLM class flavin-dependent oxidoreductase [Blastococcus sp. Marseille-P5729]|uniref:LLM class flavin-dependent oxidoreductase n=1 Tax=Blastococcus sp. Marseille-P5729 TaxID=2086582 RepID=UPI0018FE51BD|nr:LLM class flavin-dependent oxidoreductase [Blastococcus sp. Marseille-P5729]
MRIGISAQPHTAEGLYVALEADAMGVDSLWAPEAWGYDCMTPLAFLAARTTNARLISGIAQIGARTPAMLAMSAMSLQQLSGGRFVLGLGVSGPQVVEGWHGVPFAKPVQRTRETIEIVRMILRGERAAYDGKSYQLPLPGGEGKSIRSMERTPVHVPIWLAALGPANLRLTGELADGWIGNSFMPGTAGDVLVAPIADGAHDAGRTMGDIELSIAVSLEFCAESEVPEVARKHAGGYAFTFGAMGSSSTNFYSSAFARQGFGPQIEEVHRLWTSGDREGAAAAVPAEIGIGTNLIGTPSMIADQLASFQEAGVSTLRVNLVGDQPAQQVRDLGRLLEMAG